MIDLVGQKFGRLEVKEFAGTSKNRKSLWACLCTCGSNKTVRGDHLKSGETRSCGCFHKEQTSKAKTTHGQARRGKESSEYLSWGHMMSRCYDINCKDYRDYGGRGIRVCERWFKFENFYADMGDKPKDRSLDRKDNGGDYAPDNCRWATWKEQANNTRRNVWKEYKGDSRTISQWARLYNLPKQALWYRLSRPGWSIERALTTPVRGCSV
jgi:hypothetical protein